MPDAYALAGYELYLNGQIYDHSENPIDKLLRSLNKNSIYCLVSTEPLLGSNSYRLEGVFDTREEAFDKIIDIRTNTYTLPFTTRFYIINEILNKPENKTETSPPKKSELWPEPDYKRMKFFKSSLDKMYWIKCIYDSIPDYPLSRCGYDTYKGFVIELKNDVMKSKQIFDVREWMVEKGYATGPNQIFSVESLAYIKGYNPNEERLNGTGIQIPNMPNTSEGLILDAEASHFLGLKDKGISIEGGLMQTMKGRLALIQNAKKRFDKSIFGQSQSQSNSYSNTYSNSQSQSSNVQRKGPKF